MTRPASNALVRLEDASFGYPGNVVLQRVSFEVEPGDFVGLVGPNGAGKTTLFRGLLGLVPPLGGKVERSARLRRAIGYVPQRDRLDPIFPLAAKDVVAMGLTGNRPWVQTVWPTMDPRVPALMDRMSLGSLAERPFGELSGGQRQKVLIARALVSDPVLLVLDEPTAGIDPAAEDAVLTLLQEINRDSGLTILLVSHRLESLARRVHKGLLVRDGGVELGLMRGLLERWHRQEVSA